MKLFVPRETASGESRVACSPEVAGKLTELGFEVGIETGAGDSAHFPDTSFSAAGATPIDAASGWEQADVVLKVGTLDRPSDGSTAPESQRLKQGALVIGLLSPHQELESIRELAAGGVSSIAMELIPRITRAQSMDVLSSQASIAGYKAALLAATELDRYFPLLMTAAGTIPPSRVVVMGGGVAGLQALATAKRLGAVVEVSDIRPAVQQEVESLGGRFIELPLEEETEGSGGYAKQMTEEFLRRQREIVTEHLAAADVAITTAQVPGRKAPTLISREMVEVMRPGAVIIDIAAAQGGNCALTESEREIVHNGVRILGAGNLPASMPYDASLLYSRNLLALLKHIATIKEGELVHLDPEDEIVGASLLTHAGKVVHETTAKLIAAQTEKSRTGDPT